MRLAIVLVAALVVPCSAQEIGGIVRPPSVGVPSATGFTATSLPNRQVRITGKVSPPGPYTGIMVYGATAGIVMADAAGNVSWVFNVPGPGTVTIFPGDGNQPGPPVTLTVNPID